MLNDSILQSTFSFLPSGGDKLPIALLCATVVVLHHVLQLPHPRVLPAPEDVSAQGGNIINCLQGAHVVNNCFDYSGCSTILNKQNNNYL